MKAAAPRRAPAGALREGYVSSALSRYDGRRDRSDGSLRGIGRQQAAPRGSGGEGRRGEQLFYVGLTALEAAPRQRGARTIGAGAAACALDRRDAASLSELIAALRELR